MSDQLGRRYTRGPDIGEQAHQSAISLRKDKLPQPMQQTGRAPAMPVTAVPCQTAPDRNPCFQDKKEIS